MGAPEKPRARHRSNSSVSADARRVVLIAGGSSGIGLASAREAARRGDHVVLLARGLGPLEEAAAQCRTLGAASARVLQVDVLDVAAVESAFDTVKAQFGRVDVVIHSAGVVAYGRFEDVPADIFDTVVRTNVLGAANVARAALPHMRRRDAGTLVFIGSLIGQIAPPYMSAYAVSKWALRALARELHIENRDRSGVHVCIVSPGGVDTPIYLQAANYLGMAGRPPFPVVSPEKVARVALDLVDRPRPRVQVGATNTFIAAGFTLFPRLYDAIVTPLFAYAAIDRRHELPRGTGNVLKPEPALNRVHGGQGSALWSIAANALTVLKPLRAPEERV